uniref:NADH dehydrogenase subunit 4 n=1 Tax=Regioscalpellum regium TaxID=2977353 RepID=UPI0021CD040F|nr:NADH dehydrogenase subunit 4 [Regioscalpellum regium]UWM13004.1 NADH dehydrogenase subunit 4 [Regioscalpellum regium]
MLMFFSFSLGLFLISYTLSYSLFPLYCVGVMLGWLFFYPSSFIISSFLGLDSLSWFLILLTFWIILFMFLAGYSYKISGYYWSKFSFVLMLMFLLLFLTFSSLETLSFYFFFESSLIPIYLLIMGWGYQPERLQAGLYLLLYTLFASLPLLVFFLYFNNSLSSLSFILLKDLNMLNFNKSMNIWFFISIFAFLVKLPVFYVHLWLPKAHVEAPVSGSMMLAGVLLKLGCYGLMRVMPLFNSMVMYLSSILVSLGLLGGVIVSVVCLRQVDLKSLIAYSSVSHMGLALGGLGSWGLWGYSSCLYICVAHGLCSSGLFFLSGILYDRSGSRSLMINKGLLNIMPSMAFWWFMFCVSNMAAPVALNLVGELGLLGSILSFSFSCLLFLMLFSFLGACYSLYLFSNINYTKFFGGVRAFADGMIREFLILFLHYYPLLFLILGVDFMSY